MVLSRSIQGKGNKSFEGTVLSKYVHNNWAIGQNYSRLEGTIRRNRYRVPKVDIGWLF